MSRTLGWSDATTTHHVHTSVFRKTSLASRGSCRCCLQFQMIFLCIWLCLVVVEISKTPHGPWEPSANKVYSNHGLATVNDVNKQPHPFVLCRSDCRLIRTRDVKLSTCIPTWRTAWVETSFDIQKSQFRPIYSSNVLMISKQSTWEEDNVLDWRERPSLK